MMKHLEKLCLLNGTSGAEAAVREYIMAQLGDVPYTVDNLGNLIVEKKGKSTPRRKLMLSAHMDEVGLIVTCIQDDGVLSFATVGGIDPKALLGKRVRINGLLGVIGTAPVHLSEDDSVMPKEDEMYIDIGAKDRAQAAQYVRPGDTAVFESEIVPFGEGLLKAKALDDRFGCAVLLDVFNSDIAYDVTLLHDGRNRLKGRGCGGKSRATRYGFGD